MEEKGNIKGYNKRDIIWRVILIKDLGRKNKGKESGRRGKMQRYVFVREKTVHVHACTEGEKGNRGGGRGKKEISEKQDEEINL